MMSIYSLASKPKNLLLLFQTISHYREALTVYRRFCAGSLDPKAKSETLKENSISIL